MNQWAKPAFRKLVLKPVACHASLPAVIPEEEELCLHHLKPNLAESPNIGSTVPMSALGCCSLFSSEGAQRNRGAGSPRAWRGDSLTAVNSTSALRRSFSISAAGCVPCASWYHRNASNSHQRFACIHFVRQSQASLFTIVIHRRTVIDH